MCGNSASGFESGLPRRSGGSRPNRFARSVLRRLMKMVRTAERTRCREIPISRLMRKWRGKMWQRRTNCGNAGDSLERSQREVYGGQCKNSGWMISHYVFRRSKRVVAQRGHARKRCRARDPEKYGTLLCLAKKKTTGEVRRFGLQVRQMGGGLRAGRWWCTRQRLAARAEWLNRTINIDTAACLAEIEERLVIGEGNVSVPAGSEYYENQHGVLEPEADGATPRSEAHDDYGTWRLYRQAIHKHAACKPTISPFNKKTREGGTGSDEPLAGIPRGGFI